MPNYPITDYEIPLQPLLVKKVGLDLQRKREREKKEKKWEK